jgi:hypothetical protein
MQSNSILRQLPVSLSRSAALLAAGAAGVLGLGFAMASGPPGLLAFAALAALALLGVVWRSRARAARRLRAAADAWARREIARAERAHAPPKARPRRPLANLSPSILQEAD